MKFFKQFSVAFIALAAATAASAAVQPINATTATISIDAATVAASLNGYTPSAVGGATFNSAAGVLTAPVQSVSTSTNPGPMVIDLSDAAGLKFTKLANPSITLSNFSFDTATNELSGNLLVGTALFPLLNIVNQSVLVATNVSSSLGTDLGTSVTSSGSARDLGLVATNFELSQSFKDFMLNAYELDPTPYAYIGDMIKEIKIGTVYVPPVTPAVPEPSAYALMGIGLLGLSLVARRKRSA